MWQSYCRAEGLSTSIAALGFPQSLHTALPCALPLADRADRGWGIVGMAVDGEPGVVDEEVLALVRGSMQKITVPTVRDRVYKDECMFSFATSESPGGLYINLETLQAYSEAYVDVDQRRSGAVLYLHEAAHHVSIHASAGCERMVPGGSAIGACQSCVRRL